MTIIGPIETRQDDCNTFEVPSQWTGKGMYWCLWGWGRFLHPAPMFRKLIIVQSFVIIV